MLEKRYVRGNAVYGWPVALCSGNSFLSLLVLQAHIVGRCFAVSRA